MYKASEDRQTERRRALRKEAANASVADKVKQVCLQLVILNRMQLDILACLPHAGCITYLICHHIEEGTPNLTSPVCSQSHKSSLKRW